MKYWIIKNNYKESLNLEKELKLILQKDKNNKLNEKVPNYVFVIGGDGTFLEAINKYNHLLDKIIFVPIKFGGVGFYMNKESSNDISEIIKNLNSKKIKYYQALEIIDKSNKHYVINELKIINSNKPLNLEIKINNELLETFKGTGLVFSTSSGSTGFIRSAGGAIIYPDFDLFQMQELFPVTTNKFRTLNSPIIFNSKQIVDISFLNDDFDISCDTYKIKIKSKSIQVKLSDVNIRVLEINPPSKTKLLNSIFILNDKVKTN